MRLASGHVALLFSVLALGACSGKETSTGPRANEGGAGEGGGGGEGAVDPNGYCGDATPGLIAAAGEPAEPAAPLTEEPVPGSACNAVVRSYPLEPGVHVGLCSAVEYTTNPPSSGHHYPLWPVYRAFAYAVPEGFWVHNLEHGGVVITYSCSDCADEVKEAAKLLADMAPAPACCTASGCASQVSNQLVLTADPGIPTRWAASAWGFTLTADCFEPDVFENFALTHRDGAPEQICDSLSAIDVTAPNE